MTSRERFLATVRGRLSGGLPANPLRPIGEHGASAPAVDYAADLADLPAAFAAAATAAGAEVHRLDGEAALRRLLAELRDGGVATAICSRDPETAGVPALLTAAGIDVLPTGDRDAAAAADLGVTGAAYGIALTGSLVCDSTRAGTRLASLLPPTHLALLDAAALLATPGELLRDLAGRFPGGLGSNLVFVTGHSRSADIELHMTPGVHGPRRVVVALR